MKNNDFLKRYLSIIVMNFYYTCQSLPSSSSAPAPAHPSPGPDPGPGHHSGPTPVPTSTPIRRFSAGGAQARRGPRANSLSKEWSRAGHEGEPSKDGGGSPAGMSTLRKSYSESTMMLHRRSEPNISFELLSEVQSLCSWGAEGRQPLRLSLGVQALRKRSSLG